MDPQGYGNPDFCWLSLQDTLIWSFAGPVGTVVIVSVEPPDMPFRTQEPRGSRINSDWVARRTCLVVTVIRVSRLLWDPIFKPPASRAHPAQQKDLHA